MSTPQIAAVAACIVLAGLAALQAALVLGAPAGHLAWGGQHRVLPRHLRISSAVSIALYALFGAILLDRAGLLDLLDGALSSIGAWVLFAYFSVGVVMNAISRSRAERYAMTPVAAVLAGCALLVAAD
jgi:hypothetical protein